MSSVRTTKRTQHFTITKINPLTLFKKIIVYIENHARHKYTMHSYRLIIQAVPTVTIKLQRIKR
jgi:tRNA A37 threonylcarbamoyladenosine dehydratase